MLVFIKVKRISLNNIENFDIYIMQPRTILNIIWLNHIFLESQQIAEPVRKYNKPLKCIKVKNQSGTKLINWDSSRPSKWIYFA